MAHMVGLYFDDDETALVPLDKPPSPVGGYGSWCFDENSSSKFATDFGFKKEECALSLGSFGDGSNETKQLPWFFILTAKTIDEQRLALYESTLNSAVFVKAKRIKKLMCPNGLCGHYVMAIQALALQNFVSDGCERMVHSLSNMREYTNRLIAATKQHADFIGKAMAAYSYARNAEKSLKTLKLTADRTEVHI
jgi:hypothetical protein